MKWRIQAIIFYVLIAGSFSICCTVLLHYFQGTGFWQAVPVFIVVFFSCFFLFSFHKMNAAEVARILDRTHSELEDSAALLLEENVGQMNQLVRLQAERIRERFSAIQLPKPFLKLLLFGIAGVFISVFLSLILVTTERTGKLRQTEPRIDFILSDHSNPVINSVEVQIVPPSYTGLSMRTQKSMNLQAEENSLVNWKIILAEAAGTIRLIFNDSSSEAARPETGNRKIWRVSKKLKNFGYYQIEIDHHLSELYAVGIIKDQPPGIRVLSPALYTAVQAASTHAINVTAEITDDYGLDKAYLIATIASGNGEAVKFRQQKISFRSAVISGTRKATESGQIDLSALQMQPGDELYFYVEAFDNQEQRSRSGMYVVSLADTSRSSSFNGSLSASLPLPEYFRSERQIIIETEQLIKSRVLMDVRLFNEKSNDLAIDQKILRLRYGKFLGEEGEETEGVKKEKESAPADPADFGNRDKVLDQFTDKHDNAQDADFFEPETKKQLRNTLTEMWNAELKLRTNSPAEAVPFENKALRLLKDLQQKTRAYVAKTSGSSRPAPFVSRLSGELDKIVNPRYEGKAGVPPENAEKLGMALAVLQELRSGQQLSSKSSGILQEAIRIVGQQAAANPGVFLGSFQSLQRIQKLRENRGNASESDIFSASLGIQKLIQTPEPSLAPEDRGLNSGLSQYYFNNIEKLDSNP